MDCTPEDTWTSDALLREDVAAVTQRVLTDAAYLCSRDHFGNTPLQTAIEFNQVGLVELMLREGADPNIEVNDGFTCLLTAIESDNPHSIAIVEKLLDGGADLHQTGINGWTPLHLASVRGHVEKARLLLDAGARVNQRTEIDGSETPLLEAAAMGHPEIVRLLLEYGADPRMRDSVHNFTPLERAHDAARGADPQVVEFLKSDDMRSAFQNLNIAEHYRESAERRAREGNHLEVIRILAEFDDP